MLYEITDDTFRAVPTRSFASLEIRERDDLQRLLRDHVEVIDADLLVVAEEFGDWEDARRRIDLLAIDRQANLVVIELKRTDDGGHMELQALRYAAMVSTMTAKQCLEAYGRYLQSRGLDAEPLQSLLQHLGWEALDPDQFGQQVRIILVSADFSRELTTSALWLNDQGLDISCVRIRPHEHAGRALIEVRQIIPLPEAADYQVRVREKKRQERESRTNQRDFTRFNIRLEDGVYEDLPKRRAVLTAIRGLHEAGVPLDDINSHLEHNGRRRNFWVVEKETTDTEEFCQIATNDAEASSTVFDRKRWFVGSGELMIQEGKTFALSSQWGTQTERHLISLQQRYPSVIEVDPMR